MPDLSSHGAQLADAVRRRERSGFGSSGTASGRLLLTAGAALQTRNRKDITPRYPERGRSARAGRADRDPHGEMSPSTSRPASFEELQSDAPHREGDVRRQCVSAGRPTCCRRDVRTASCSSAPIQPPARASGAYAWPAGTGRRRPPRSVTAGADRASSRRPGGVIAKRLTAFYERGAQRRLPRSRPPAPGVRDRGLGDARGRAGGRAPSWSATAGGQLVYASKVAPDSRTPELAGWPP